MDVYNNAKLLGKQGKYTTRSIKNSVTVFTNSFLCMQNKLQSNNRKKRVARLIEEP
jgi:hypothetical protein